ncbi:MAG: hypothetical protein QOH43_1748 [Solirubrobacteraceae bacterium]|nr:hypothetical protein [Solirubrobacteraceae bacterium]
MHEVRVELRPPWPLRLPGGGMDGVLRRRGGVVERMLHVEGCPAIVRAAQPSPGRLVVGGWSERRDVAAEAGRRMALALGAEDDLSAFCERFRFDPLIGPSVRRAPWLRPMRRAEPFEALAWGICEQLIEYERAAAIQRRIVRRHGPQCPDTGLRDVPGPRVLAGVAPARLQAMDLSAGRALALVKAARMVAAGRVDLHAADHEAAWRRLRTIPGIGSWTTDVLALHGQGRLDVLPAGDLAYRKLVARLTTGGNPHARAEEAEVRAFFAPYEGWAGLAGVHALRATGRWAAAAGAPLRPLAA